MNEELKSAFAATRLKMNISESKILNSENQHIKTEKQTIDATNEYIYLDHKIQLGKYSIINVQILLEE